MSSGQTIFSTSYTEKCVLSGDKLLNKCGLYIFNEETAFVFQDK